MQVEKGAVKKSLLAVLFVSGLFNSPVPASSDPESLTPDAVIQNIAKNSNYDAQTRAYYLLRLASRLLDGTESGAAAKQFRFLVKGASKYDGWEIGLERWARQISYANHEADACGGKFKLSFTPSENLPFASSALREATDLLGSASDEFVKLNLYFVSFGLFRKIGNSRDAQKCDKVLQNAIRACEQDKKAGEGEIKGVVSVLNAMAYGYIAVQVSDENPADNIRTAFARKPVELWSPPAEAEFYTEEDFEKSEKLRLRALSLVDRLPATSNLRRRAHRDMALWYLQLNKLTAANKEKQTLFELVGIHDDCILYPVSVGCGHFIWWDKPRIKIGCGMG